MAHAVEEFKLQAIAKAEREASDREAKNREAEQARKAELQKFATGFETAIGRIVETVSATSQSLQGAAHSLTRTADTTQQLTSIVASASRSEERRVGKE